MTRSQSVNLMNSKEDPELDWELYQLVSGLFFRKSFMEMKI